MTLYQYERIKAILESEKLPTNQFVYSHYTPSARKIEIANNKKFNEEIDELIEEFADVCTDSLAYKSVRQF